MWENSVEDFYSCCEFVYGDEYGIKRVYGWLKRCYEVGMLG